MSRDNIRGKCVSYFIKVLSWLKKSKSEVYIGEMAGKYPFLLFRVPLIVSNIPFSPN